MAKKLGLSPLYLAYINKQDLRLEFSHIFQNLGEGLVSIQT